MSSLAEIQRALKAPKGKFNDFGKYKYRSCEDILEAVKPLLEGCTLTITDELVLIGERYYIKATAAIQDDSGNISQSSAYAREAAEKKGMDSAQVTGSTSSYARKYALGGLFLLDDNQDDDTRPPSDKPADGDPLGANTGDGFRGGNRKGGERPQASDTPSLAQARAEVERWLFKDHNMAMGKISHAMTDLLGREFIVATQEEWKVGLAKLTHDELRHIWPRLGGLDRRKADAERNGA